MPDITIHNLKVVVSAAPGQSLLNSLLIKEQPIHTVCGGRARCGCCRVRIRAGAKGASPINQHERTRLTQEELDSGWRLGCQTYIVRDISIDLPAGDELPAHCSKKG